ncbi:hypothetical protein [Streptomyces sp. NPDC058086]|uniref:hypothetical protein n=1 Tax=Streptomyces sp. NPDC058086 TaxID=3346334 RepID=UPI0036F14A50
MSTLADLADQALRRIRLQQARVELAAALQQSMLPTLPEHLPGLEVAARYRSSRDGLDIGRDWCDAFVMPCAGVGRFGARLASTGLVRISAGGRRNGG